MCQIDTLTDISSPPPPPVKNWSFQIVEFDYSTNEGRKSPHGLKLTGQWIAEYPQEVCHRNKIHLESKAAKKNPKKVSEIARLARVYGTVKSISRYVSRDS